MPGFILPMRECGRSLKRLFDTLFLSCACMLPSNRVRAYREREKRCRGTQSENDEFASTEGCPLSFSPSLSLSLGSTQPLFIDACNKFFCFPLLALFALFWQRGPILLYPTPNGKRVTTFTIQYANIFTLRFYDTIRAAAISAALLSKKSLDTKGRRRANFSAIIHCVCVICVCVYFDKTTHVNMSFYIYIYTDVYTYRNFL